MKAKVLIKKLEKLVEKYGNLEVHTDPKGSEYPEYVRKIPRWGKDVFMIE